MQTMYKITEDIIIFENKEYITYGVKYDNEFYIDDVSLNKKEVEKLVRLCNDGELHPIHLYDIIEDFLEK